MRSAHGTCNTCWRKKSKTRCMKHHPSQCRREFATRHRRKIQRIEYRCRLSRIYARQHYANCRLSKPSILMTHSSADYCRIELSDTNYLAPAKTTTDSKHQNKTEYKRTLPAVLPMRKKFLGCLDKIARSCQTIYDRSHRRNPTPSPSRSFSNPSPGPCLSTHHGCRSPTGRTASSRSAPAACATRLAGRATSANVQTRRVGRSLVRSSEVVVMLRSFFQRGKAEGGRGNSEFITSAFRLPPSPFSY